MYLEVGLSKRQTGSNEAICPIWLVSVLEEEMWTHTEIQEAHIRRETM